MKSAKGELHNYIDHFFTTFRKNSHVEKLGETTHVKNNCRRLSVFVITISEENLDTSIKRGNKGNVLLSGAQMHSIGKGFEMTVM